MDRALPLLLAGLAACSSAPPSPAFGEAPFELATPCVVALEPDSRPIARVGLGVGEPRRFLLDSGSSITLISGVCADALGLERRPYGSTFELTGSGGASVRLGEYVRLEWLDIGALVVHSPAVAVMDDPVLAQAGVDGILGQDLLARLVLVVDMQRDRVHILPSCGTEAIRALLAQTGAGEDAWTTTPLELRPCPFATWAAVGGRQPVEFEIDTGSGDTSLPESAIAALGLECVGLRMSGGVGGNFTENLYRLEDSGLFGLEGGLDVTASPRESGLIGMNVLGARPFVLDGPGRALWLQRGG